MASNTNPRSQFFFTIAQHWKQCFVIPLALAAVTFLGTLVMPKSYRAVSLVQLTTIDPGRDKIHVTGMKAREVTAFFREAELLEETLTKFGLRDEPYEYDHEDLRRSLVEVDVPRALEQST